MGHGVKDLKVNDRVVALGQGTLASVIVQSEALCVRLSEGLTFNDAAYLSLVYTTAIYALSHVARLTKGQVCTNYPQGTLKLTCHYSQF